MGHLGAHFEVIGKDGQKVQNLYGDLFGWRIDANDPANYGLARREARVNANGVGVGGRVGPGPTPDYAGPVSYYVEVPDVEAALSARPSTTPPDRPAARSASRCPAASSATATTPASTPTACSLRSASAFLASSGGGLTRGITMATVIGAAIVLVAARWWPCSCRHTR
jgi:hypothetical protein